MRILFVGDVMGRPGRRALHHFLPELIASRSIDYVIVNIENAAGGFGITPEVFRELEELPIDCFTTGNHVWDKRAGIPLLAETPRLLRPANYPPANPGHGVHVGETEAGVRVATVNLEGQVFMKPLASPFETLDRLLGDLPRQVRIVVVDFHAEATSEKQAIAYYADGRVTAVLGTHTHVPTADGRILAGGTALVTDVGMTGPYDGIIGCRSDKVLKRFLTQAPAPLEVAKGDVRLAAAVVDADEESGKAVALESLLLPMP
ncbi:MAG: TIGR00282 family metallophosphoesterase [Thermoanaerobaculia bacterium]|nr:TIGR00282 family metallophosphoesterase [Thermoanaerobaculia bacterium]